MFRHDDLGVSGTSRQNSGISKQKQGGVMILHDLRGAEEPSNITRKGKNMQNCCGEQFL